METEKYLELQEMALAKEKFAERALLEAKALDSERRGKEPQEV